MRINEYRSLADKRRNLKQRLEHELDVSYVTGIDKISNKNCKENADFAVHIIQEGEK